MKTTILGAIALGLTLGLSAPAAAQNKPDERVKGIKMKRVRPTGSENVRGAKMKPAGGVIDKKSKGKKGKGKPDGVGEQGKAHEDAAHAKGKGKGKAMSAEERAAWQARARTQRTKAKARLQEHGKGTVDAAVAAQQKRHAKRVAQLERIREVAKEKGDSQTVERADALLTKENLRFDGWLKKMSDKKAGEADKEKAE